MNNISWFQGEVYFNSVRKLYDSVNKSNEYDNWKKHFTYIHGEFNTQRKINTIELEEIFNVPLGECPKPLFDLIYCLETYYSIILRIIGYKTVFGPKDFSINIFSNKIYEDKGIINYSCNSFYNWFLQIPDIDDFLSELYEIISLSDIESEGDAISTIFEYIFPKEIRHSVGEYYTPYWLANNVIDQLTKDDKNACLKKYIDPTCGSATFIVALINKFKSESKNAIFTNVCGIDINPLTVLAAKTNYLLLYSKNLGFNNETKLEIPIYCADTIAINDISETLFTEFDEYDTVPQIKYDYIVGNPPWVNWEYMPKSYRSAHAQLWQHYGLFTQKGLDASFIKEDISVLVTYVAIDNYLKNGGKIGFVIKETLFKSIKQGEGFRKFRITPQNIDLKVLRVDDLTQIKPFKNAVTRTAIIYIEKGASTEYPIDYVVWHSSSKTKPWENISFKYLKARPSIATQPNSGWITETQEEMISSEQVLGSNNLVARIGVFTGGANGIYWLNINSDNGNSIFVSNITERAKNKMKKVQLDVEKDYVFPFLTGNDLRFWSYSYSKYILCPHTSETKMYPIDFAALSKHPLTADYFLQFKTELQERKGFTSMDKSIHEQYYYTLQRIGIYTFAPYKVCWRYISKNFTPAVVEYAEDSILGLKNIICNEKIISIGLENKDEAYFICGVISSTPYRRTIENYMVGTQITPSIINRLNIPSFESTNEQHLEISRLCNEGHKQPDKARYIEKIDDIVIQWIRGH